jgi:hypothetical protein
MGLQDLGAGNVGGHQLSRHDADRRQLGRPLLERRHLVGRTSG